ncbi:MAG TPA: hypothetical protein VHA52_00200 [Candidatus Babeliaceae bacterium]|nr:hypothetical protein [Candidatus Babeliaceae bacterium]
MKNKESLLKWSHLLKILAKICIYLGIGIDAAILIGNIETRHIHDIRSFVSVISFLIIIFFIANVLEEILLSISEIIKAVIDVAENLEEKDNKDGARYFTK